MFHEIFLENPRLRLTESLRAMHKSTPVWIASIFAVLAIIAKLKFLPLEANFAMFGALSLYCGAHLRGWMAWLIPTGAIVLSDLIGQYFQVPGVYFYDARAMLMNYAGFAAMIGIAHLLRRPRAIEFTIGTLVGGSLAFFVISNFGVWLDPAFKNEPSLAGLVQCYVQGIPFYRNTFASDMFFSGLLFVTHYGLMSTADAKATHRIEG